MRALVICHAQFQQVKQVQQQQQQQQQRHAVLAFSIELRTRNMRLT